MTQNHVIVFFFYIFYSYRFLRWWAPCRQEVRFSSFLWVWKHPWSRVNRCHLLFSFPFIAFHVAFISSHVPVILLSCLSCSVAMYQRLSKIQVFESYAQTGQVMSGFFFRPKRPNVVFICRLVVVVIVVAIVFEACAGCHLQASWTRTCGLAMRAGSVKVQAKLRWNARADYTIPCVYASVQNPVSVLIEKYLKLSTVITDHQGFASSHKMRNLDSTTWQGPTTQAQTTWEDTESNVLRC